MVTDPFNELNLFFDKLRFSYQQNPYPSLQERKTILTQLKQRLTTFETSIYDALAADYAYRSQFDSFIGDLLPSILAINYALKNLKKWMAPSKRRAGLVLAPSTLQVMYQPLGIVGIIVPWNFPLFLALGPAIQALAAGNRVMIKMSEFTPKTNQVIQQIFEPLSDHVVIIQGERDIGEAFSKLPFHHLVFTGSTMIGRAIAKNAADKLTPITLELGGKSPVIIDKTANINTAIDAIIMGKIINAGQICVSPDYIFVPDNLIELFVNRFKERFLQYFNNHKVQLSSIINEKQFNRLNAYLEDANNKGATIHTIKPNNTSNYKFTLYPHLLVNVNEEMAIMQNEIFGPLIPLITYNNIDTAIDFINARENPLALYIMSKDKLLIDKILKQIHCGGVCINDTIMHVMAEDAPFGGIGASGFGQYHGHEGFLTFSKAKTIFTSKPWLHKNKWILKHRTLTTKMLRMLYL